MRAIDNANYERRRLNKLDCGYVFVRSSASVRRYKIFFSECIGTSFINLFAGVIAVFVLF